MLPHEDNHPGEQDETFLKNVEVAKGFQDNLKYGCEISEGEVTEFKTDFENLIWLKIK